jgi:4'-phosphopantetheinyl transferase EntD
MGVFGELLAGTPAAVEEEDPRGLADPLLHLLPEELGAVASARPNRQREFAAGRRLARRALARLGAGAAPLCVGPERAPLWPAGFVGSITHTSKWCAVAVAPAAQIAGIGIDVEQDEPLAERLWSLVCTARDVAWLGAQPEAERGRLGKVLFSAKESAFKAQYPLTGQFIDFLAMSVEVDWLGGVWRAQFEIEVPPRFAPGDELYGRCSSGSDLLATALLLLP